MTVRSTPEYFSGTITGSNVVQDLYTVMKSRLQQFQSNSVDAWEEFDVVTATAGSRNIVWRSKGDRTLVSGAGDARLFFRMTEAATQFTFYVYQDWTTDGSGSGTNEVGLNNAVTRWTGLSATSECDYWGVVNEYEFVMVVLTQGAYLFLWFGSPRRTYIPPNGQGIAFLGSGSSAPTTDGVSSITNVSGTATLVSDATPFAGGGGDVGRYIRIAGATNTDNDGDFLILTNASTSVVTYATTAGDGSSETSSPATLELDVTHSLDRDLSVSSPGPRMAAGQKTWIYEISVIGGTVADLTQAGSVTTLDSDGTPFVSGDTGKSITITGSTNPLNDGTFTVTYVDSNTVTYTNASGVTDSSSPASWSLENALKGADSVICDVKAVGSSTITTLGTVTTYDTGAIVGLDPCPMGLRAVQTATSINLYQFYFTNLNDASYVGTTGQLYNVNCIVGHLTEASVDPGSEGYYIGQETLLESTSLTAGGARGTPEIITFWAQGAQVSGDRMQNNLSTADADSWVIFPPFYNSQPSSTFYLAIGPGAT